MCLKSREQNISCFGIGSSSPCGIQVTMLPEIPSLPFSIPNVYQGFAEAKGILRTTENGLLLEFQVKDGVVGVLKSGINEVHVTLDQLSNISLKAGWFRTMLHIRTRSMAALKGIPGNEPGQIALQIARKDRTIAQAVASGLMLRLSEKNLERFNQDRPLLDQ
jgi:hypothetical protein